MISSICRSLLPCASNLIISRSLSVTTTCNSLEKSINYKSRTGRTPAEGTEGEMFYNISSDRAKKHIDNWIPTIETLDEYFNGVKYSDIPVCHIFCTKNNTKVTVTEVGTNETLLYTSASKEGFKNAKKKTEVAGQATGIAVGLKCLRRDITQTTESMNLLRNKIEDINVGSLRRLFYAVHPNETFFEDASVVPNFIEQSFGWFIIFMLLEIILIGGKLWKLNDTLTSMGAGIMESTFKLLSRTVQFRLYCWFFDNYHILDLHWHSKWTWFCGFIGVDFFYYWFHRAAHVAIMWATHQMHHSSNYYNLSTALRQSIIQQFASMWFYLPMALVGVPPSAFLVHSYLNLLFQFWIHTQLIPPLPSLELIINTPSLHRVHHGRNKYCIDKNYAGTLIIWDRMFGTFQSELPEEPVVYGLILPLKTFDPLYTQMFYMWDIIYKKPMSFKSKSFVNWVKCLVFKPSWHPDFQYGYPNIKQPVKIYNPKLPNWLNSYIFTHFLLCLSSYVFISSNRQTLPDREILFYSSFILASLQIFGMLFDKK